MTYEEALKETEQLKAHLQGAFSVNEKERIHALYSAVLRKTLKVTSCQRCYHDALIEIILYLRKEGKMKEETQYGLRAGFIIHSSLFHNGKIYTNDNLTDEVAREYLAMFPDKRPMFSRTPKETIVERSEAVKAEEPTTAPTTAQKAVKRKKSKK